MDLLSRDAFDAALVLVYAHSASTASPTSVVDSVAGALVSLNPIVYLVVLGFVGILFVAYGVLYLPTQADGR